MDDDKPDGSAKPKAPRHDTRAEPDSAALPEPEELVTGRRRIDSTPAPRSLRSSIAPTRGSVPDASEVRGSLRPGATPSESGETASLRRQVAVLQAELTQTQRRLANVQEARIEDGDRIANLVARVQGRGTGAESSGDDGVAQAKAAAHAEDAEQQIRAMASQLSANVARMELLQAERDSLAASLQRVESERAELRAALAAATDMVAAIARWDAAIVAAEDAAAHARDDASTARSQLGEQVLELRLALERMTQRA